MRLLSQLYAVMYITRRRDLLGVSLATWLVIMLPLLSLWAFMLRWPSWISPALLIMALALTVAYWIAGRRGYTRFVSDGDMVLDPEFAAPRDENRVPMRATGVFSVREYERYVLEEPAEYWRVPLGHHVFMVQYATGQFLYQIVEPQHIRRIEPGYLLYGRQPQKAIALHFLVSWSPEMSREPRFYQLGAEEESERVPTEERTIYCTFDHDADRFAVWRSLLESSS